MSSVKIAFFDIDGTMIDMERKKMTPLMLETLQRLKENHIHICIATGRSPMALPHFDVEFDTFLTFNGSYCYNDKETIFSNPIPSEDIQTIIKNAAAIHRPLCLSTKDRLAANGTDQDLSDYFDIAKLPVPIVDDFDDVAKEQIYQIMVGCRKPEYSLLVKDAENAKIAAWWDRAADIIPANGGKGIAVEQILKYYHLDKSESIAFGDGNNDIEMLQAVGTGVAMENASEQIKKVADDFCGHVAEDGIYHYCVEHQLI